MPADPFHAACTRVVKRVADLASDHDTNRLIVPHNLSGLMSVPAKCYSCAYINISTEVCGQEYLLEWQDVLLRYLCCCPSTHGIEHDVVLNAAAAACRTGYLLTRR